MNRLRRGIGSARAWLHGRPRFLAAAIVLMALGLAIAAGGTFWFCHDLVAGLPGEKEIHGLGDMAQATTIFDAHDVPVFTIFREQRIEVPLAQVSPLLVNAVVSVEDQRFYDHSGVDVIRIMAAAVRNFREGRRAEGGSTITQQLARQSFLTRDKTYRRKLKEAVLAARIERQFTKPQILEMYLNKVYFGDGLYGVEAAARGYFGKHASELNVAEAALLAGLIQSPSSYAPTVNPDRAVARRTVVLGAMLSNHAISQDDYDRARHAPMRLSNGIEMKESFGLYFKEQVRRELVERFGATRIAEGGLRVYATIDPALQHLAEKVVEDGIATIERRRGYRHQTRDTADDLDYLQGALVALEPGTGAVRALVGGRDFNESHFNRATQARRQSGSAFKPFVYAAALEAGYSPASLISNLNAAVDTPEGKWMPEDGHSDADAMTMRSALKISSNRAAVQMLTTVGIPAAVSYAQKMNVGTPPSVPSLALGTSDVTLLSLTSAYGAFADAGTLQAPVLIRRVEDADGTVLYTDPAHAQRVLSESSAFLMSSMLADVITSGTAYKARQMGFTLPAAGKTGTTNDYVDAWFVGYTPHLVTGVWVGFDQPKTIIANGYAADVAVPIWAAFMKTATRGDKADWFERPANVIGVNVCRLSGQLPNTGCASVLTPTDNGTLEARSMVYTDYFVKGRQPTTLCPLHPLPNGSATMIAAGAPPGSVPGEPAPGVTPPGVPVGTVGASPPLPGTVAPDQEPKKKRGFWGRLFGRGGG
ncbi:MAG TPA: PBP1A family penicillin-binding protein [Vicinamibacterales bacterium]|jgi:penicillin-binding protein 1A